MLRNRFTYSNVVATLALVFAMSGGALAASKYLITSTKQIKPSVLSSLKGKAGKAGAVGPAGAVGAVGPAGAAGTVGPAGPQGPAGDNGAPGAEGKAGKNGANGKEGSPWTDKGTLPAGATETGVWEIGPAPEGVESYAKTAISFPIPLAAPIATSNVHVFEGTQFPTGCSGTVIGGPGEEAVTELKAASGSFCVWVRPFSPFPASEIGAYDFEMSFIESGVGTHGAQLAASKAFKGEGLEEATGTWAVTG
jgi:hypothetical protein